MAMKKWQETSAVALSTVCHTGCENYIYHVKKNPVKTNKKPW